MLNLPIFSERLQDFMFDNKISPEKLSKAVGVDLSMVYRWTRGECFPLTLTLIKIADLFSCSLDYLFGFTNDNSCQTFKPSPLFGEQLCNILKQRGLTEYRVCKDTKISRSRFGDWRKNIRVPIPENLIILTEYFDCSIDYLIGRE